MVIVNEAKVRTVSKVLSGYFRRTRIGSNLQIQAAAADMAFHSAIARSRNSRMVLRETR